MTHEHIHFVTGRLAAQSLEKLLPELAAAVGFEYSVEVLPITVAALMTPAWIAGRWNPPAAADRVLLPGYCEGDLQLLAANCPARIERGPKDLRQLASYFLQEPQPTNYGAWDIEIIAEINHCSRLALAEIIDIANRYAAAGANVIDVGCTPGEIWSGVAEAVSALRDAGHRVSIDSLNVNEIAAATAAGAELVLSVNSTNRDAAADWGAEVVVIPDDPRTLVGLEETVDQLAKQGVPLRIDPVLEPIGFGFTASIERCIQVRRRYVDAEMMLGIGNLTELTDVDSAGVNMVLVAICQELSIRSVLTTEVINWARTAVAECAVARELAYHAVSEQVLPKHLDRRLLMLRDEAVVAPSAEELAALAEGIRDNSFRIFAAADEVHLIGSNLHLHNADPFVVMQQLGNAAVKNLTNSHAFYLGYELCKARTSLTLGKQYVQDEPLDWGLATRDEPRHYLQHDRGNDPQDD